MVAQLPRPDARPTAGAGRAAAAPTIAPMRRRHLRAVLAIEEQVYPRPWSLQLFATELAQPETRAYVVALEPHAGGVLRVPGRPVVVGYAGVLVLLGEAHVTTVAVHPREHRRKIATRLLLAVLTEARRRGAEAATLEVRVANRGAQRLYAGFGFVPVGIRPGYYAETGEDALIMWAHDLQGDEIAERLAQQQTRLAAPGGASGSPDLHVPWVRGRTGLGEGGRGSCGDDRGRGS